MMQSRQASASAEGPAPCWQNFLSTTGVTYSTYVKTNRREPHAKCYDPEDELPALRSFMGPAAGGRPHLPEVQESLLGPAQEASGRETQVAAQKRLRKCDAWLHIILEASS